MLHYRKTKVKYNSHNNADKKVQSCGFCDAETSARHVYETDTIAVIPNRVSYDMFEGRRVTEHLMVIPKQHRESFVDFTQQEQLETMQVIAKYETEGYNIYARGVGSISRSMKHQHTHLIKLSQRTSNAVFYIKRPYFLLNI